MRRTLLTALGTMALALAGPGAALAAHGHGHHKGHHKGRAHHARVHFLHFGAKAASEPGTGTGTGTGTSGPTTPTTPENAGTVASYVAPVLTLTLSDGSTVKGNVTNNTEIQCIKATPPASAPTSGQPSDQSPGDDSGQGDDQSGGDVSQQQGDQQSSSSDQPQQGEDGQDSSDDGAEVQSAAPEAPCDTTALTPNTVVRSAELRVGPSGSEFESLVLVR